MPRRRRRQHPGFGRPLRATASVRFLACLERRWIEHRVPAPVGVERVDGALRSASGGNVTLLATLPDGAAYPNLSPDWTKVAFRFGTDLRIMDIDGSGVTDIPIDTYDLAWEP